MCKVGSVTEWAASCRAYLTEQELQALALAGMLGQDVQISPSTVDHLGGHTCMRSILHQCLLDHLQPRAWQLYAHLAVASACNLHRVPVVYCRGIAVASAVD